MKLDLSEILKNTFCKICVKPGYNASAIQEAGYNGDFVAYSYFLGSSRYGSDFKSASCVRSHLSMVIFWASFHLHMIFVSRQKKLMEQQDEIV